MKYTLLVSVLIVALMAAILVSVTGCGGSSGPPIVYDPRFTTAASSPNPPSKVVGNVTPSGDDGADYQVIVTGRHIDTKRLSDGRFVFGRSTTGDVLALAARRNLAANRFDIVTIESDQNVYDYNGGPGQLVAAAAGCKYVAIEGLKAIASVDGTKVDFEQLLPGVVVPTSE